MDRIIEYFLKKSGGGLITKPMKVGFWAAVGMALLAHFVALSNILNNYDSITQLPAGVGTGASSGRWMLTLIEMLQVNIWYDYNIPFWNIAVGIFLIAISAALVVKRLSIDGLFNAFLIGSIMTVFPAVTSMFFFAYTAPHYCLAIWMTVLATCICDRHWWGKILSVVLLAMGLGIYQAYIPVAAGLFVLVMINDLLQNENTNIWGSIKKGICYVSILLMGILLYLLLNKIVLAAMGLQLSTYRGINDMGKLSGAKLLDTLKQIYENIYMLPSKNYVGISATPVTQKAFLILSILVAAEVVLLCTNKKYSVCVKVLSCILVLILPIAADLIEILVSDGYVYTLMIYGMCTLLFLPIVLDEIQWKSISEATFGRAVFTKISSVICGCVLFTMVLNYSWSSNVNYTLLYYTNEQTREYLSSMATRMRSADGYEEGMDVAFVGKKIKDTDFTAAWGTQPVMYGGMDTNFLNYYSRRDFMSAMVGYTFTQASNEIVDELKNRDDVISMNPYPNDNSIKVIDDILVVKLSE